MLIYNVFVVVVSYLLMVVILNMIIALLTGMYERVVDSTEREFSFLTYTDY